MFQLISHRFILQAFNRKKAKYIYLHVVASDKKVIWNQTDSSKCDEALLKVINKTICLLSHNTVAVAIVSKL